MELIVNERIDNNVGVMTKAKLFSLIEKPITGEWGSEGNSIPVLRTTNFSNEGRLNLKDIVYRDIDLKKVESKKLKNGDIIIEKSGGSPTQPVGRVVYFDLEGTFLCNNFTSILRPKKDIIQSKYLLYQLFASHKFGFTNNYQNKTTGIINLKLERYIKELEIPLPSLPTQQKIAEILDTADQLRQYDKQLIEKYDALTQSLFLEMFGDPVRNEKGWEKVGFSKVAKNENSKRVPVRQSDRDEREGKYPYYGATGIIDTIDDYKFDGEYLLIAEDGKNLLFRKKNNAFIAKGKFWVNNHAHILSFNNVCNLKYLEFFLNSLDLGPYISGIDQIKLNKASLDRIPVTTPPIELQTQFAERIQMIEAQKQQAQEALSKSENLFQSLLQKAFKGELV